MQCGGGGSHGAGCAGKNSLVTLAVLGRVGVVAGVLLAFDIRGQGQVAVALHQIPGALVGRAVQGEAEQRPLRIGPAAQQRAVKATGAEPSGQVHGAAGQGLFADLHVGHHLVASEHALDQQLQLAATGFLAKEARLDDAGVVEDQQVARLQQAGQGVEDAVHRRQAAAIEQARGTALGGGVLGDALRGQGEVKVAQGESTGRVCGGLGHGA